MNYVWTVSWSITAKGSWTVPHSNMSSLSQHELCCYWKRQPFFWLSPPCTSTNSLYRCVVNQVNDGSVQLSSSVRCCTSACVSIKSKEDTGPLARGRGRMWLLWPSAVQQGYLLSLLLDKSAPQTEEWFLFFLEILKKKIYLVLS